MSLQIWLPFNGSLVNQGVYNSTITSTSPQYSTSGKIGKALSLASNGNYTVKTTYTQNNNEMSICFWVNPNNPGIWTDIFSFGGNNRMEVSSDDKKSYTWYVDSGKQGLISSGTYLFGLNLSTWSHVVIAIDTSSVYFYVNGTLTKTVSRLSTTFASIFAENAFFYVGARVANNCCYAGLINDFRVYDECLSPKQVKEISKGLVCHYPLDNNGCGQTNLYDFETIASKWTNEGESSLTTITDSNYGNVLKITSVANQRIYRSVSNVWITNGGTYIVSFLAKASSNGAVCNMSRSLADFSPNFTLTTDWKYYSGVITLTATSTGGTLSFKTVTANVDFYITRIKLENGNIATPYCPGSGDSNYAVFNINSNKEIDISGYSNHGTKNGTITYNSDVPRYSTSTYFSDGKNNYISSPITLGNDAITMSIWIKSKNGTKGTGDYHIPFNINSEWYEFSIDPSGYFRNGFHINNSRVVDTTNVNVMVDKKWHLLVATYDGSNIKRYVDGNLISTHAATGTLRGGSLTLCLGRFLNNNTYGDIELYKSDLRIYATALSADDIKQLYQVSASIDNNGNVFTEDFEEIISLDKPTIGQNSVIQNNEFDESDAMDLITTRRTMTYVPAKDTNNSCLDAAAIIFDYDDTETTASTVYRIIANVSWSGFDSSSTAGTFSLYWQGSTRKIETSTWVWEGGNHICSALNSQKSLQTLVLSATSGTFVYDTTFTLPDSWRTTYNGSNIGFRANYSNGVGRITINDIKIILDKYSSTTSTKAHMGKDFMAGASFIEI